MTYLELLAQIISEAMEIPIEDVKDKKDLVLKMVGDSHKLHETLSDKQAQEWLVKLRSELPAIRSLLIGSVLKTEADIAQAQGRIN